VYPAGTQLPPIEALAKELSVSRGALRDALKLLEAEGVLYSMRGLGTFVSNSMGAIQSSLNQLQSTTEMARNFNLELRAKVLGVQEIEASPEVAVKLGLDPLKDRVVRIERLRFASNEPVIHSTDYVVASLLPSPVRPEMFEGSLFELLETTSQVKVVEATSTVSAVASSVREGRLLGISEHIPLILLEQVHFDSRMRRCIYSRDFYRADRFKFVVRRRQGAAV
ncbi:MAG: GntR family transcriptional regulator, partial [Chloroflexi bacterium]|nr:GntR family transcriptional regulator [Chloroflexota bacterium]